MYIIRHLECKPSKKTSDVELVTPASVLDRRNSSNNPGSIGNMKGVHSHLRYRVWSERVEELSSTSRQEEAQTSRTLRSLSSCCTILTGLLAVKLNTSPVCRWRSATSAFLVRTLPQFSAPRFSGRRSGHLLRSLERALSAHPRLFIPSCA